jgi:hypothetical protein
MTPRERVAELQKRPGDGRCAIVVEGRGTGIPLDLVAARYLFGIETEGDGPYGFYTIRGPIPDPPKPQEEVEGVIPNGTDAMLKARGGHYVYRWFPETAAREEELRW